MRTVELRVLCEGQTEQGFVTQVLAPHLKPFRVFPTPELLVRGRGGIVPFKVLYAAIKRDVGRSKSHQFVTTMVDLYKLGDYPGVEKRPGELAGARTDRIELGMSELLRSAQFIPYVQTHEFEALVFVDLDELPKQFPDGEAEAAPELLRKEIGALAPEAIDDGPTTAPSKRLITAIPAYAALKPVVGPAITARIGIHRLRAACPHFDAWVTRLERLANPP